MVDIIIIVAIIFSVIIFAVIAFLIIKFKKKASLINKEEDIKIDKSDWKKLKDINEIDNDGIKNIISILHKDEYHEKKIFNNFLKGKYNDMEFVYFMYNTLTTGSRRGNPFNSHVFVVECKKSKQNINLISKDGIPFGFLSKDYIIPKEENIDWMYVSDIAEFKKLNISYANRYKLKEILSKNLFRIDFYPGYIVCYVEVNSLVSIEKVYNRLQDIYLLRTILD